MKTGILLTLLLAGAVSVQSQSLKDLLYSGKLKSDTGTVVRKTDDLSTKIDTTTKKPVEPEKTKIATMSRDSSMSRSVVQMDSVATPATAAKDNNKIWKDYIDELTGTLRTEVLPSKKIKSGTYSILIEYEIGLDGGITVNSVSASPESSYLEQQVKERITLSAPQLTPLLNNYGKPRKAVKKQTIILAK